MRIEKDSLGLDEVVMEKCHFHIERMSDTSFWIGISNNKDGYHYINLSIEKGKLIARIDTA